MNNIIQIKRRLLGGAEGAPTSLSGGEIAFNENDKVLYYGYNGGTVNGDGNPGSVIGIAGPGLFVDRTTDQTVGGIKTFTATVSALGNVEVDGNVDAHTFSIDGTGIVDSSRNAEFANIDASGNLTVQGDFTVYGNSTVIETTVTAASAFKIEASGPTTALEVIQLGSAVDIAEFKDDSNTALIIKEGGNVGINTNAPNKTLTVVGDISATGNIDISSATTLGSTLTVTDATTLNSTLYVSDAVSFNSTLSAKGSVEIDSTLTVDDLATFNNDVTVIDKLQVQSTDYDGAGAGTYVEILGTSVKVADDVSSANTVYGLYGIDVSSLGPVDYILETLTNDIVINAGAGSYDLDITAANTNITTGALNVQVGDLNGNGSNFIHDFIIDGGTF